VSITSTLDIGIQIASALVEAHRAGIIHRDLKPANVMIRPTGLVKLLDFGIARLSAPAEAATMTATAILGQTQTGMVIGTPQFMSPEQARGTAINHQTDLFSLGVLLYELLSGASPFAADTVSDVIVAVLTREPSRLTDVPPKLAAVVSKALQKDRSRRYETATELLRDLTDVKQDLERTAIAGPIASTRDVRSIAVLPFANMSADEDSEHFCARAPHQHERRMDLLRSGNAGRGLAAGCQDDGERRDFPRRVLVTGRDSSERRCVRIGGRATADNRVARRSSDRRCRPGLSLQSRRQRDEAAAILRRLLELRRQQYVPAICLARVYSRSDDTVKAIEWLETAFAERNGEMVFLNGEIAGAAQGDALRRLADEPRVLALLDSMHLP
jgi:protein kinase-like protein